MSNKKTIGFVNNGLAAPRLSLTKGIPVRHGNIQGPAASVAPAPAAPPLTRMEREMRDGDRLYKEFLKTAEGQRRAAARARIAANNSLTNAKKHELSFLGNRGGKSTKRTRKHKSKRRHSRRK